MTVARSLRPLSLLTRWDFNDTKRRPGREYFLHEFHGDVVHRNVAFRAPFRATVMGVAVKYRSYGVTIERLLEPARAQKGKDFFRLTDHRCLNRRVMKQYDSLRRAQLGECRF